ncbi:VOC family protein [Haladaptatus sp. F3-133]|jgi:lactoylglutathione lyase|uniref:VOC family protein n=1 Tax=Halorutilus salinus TaxID=2487751 RepID=A0A9Q4C2Z6_9EURY|nr:VOC family protein [Halorutilus salinus]
MVGSYIDHTMIRVEDREESIDWYREKLDWVVHREVSMETFDLIFIGPEDSDDDDHLIELTYNHPDDETGEKQTYDFGDAWGHFAIAVDDVYDTYDELMERGVEDYRDPDSCGGSYAFVKDPDGHEIELVERDL